MRGVFPTMLGAFLAAATSPISLRNSVQRRGSSRAKSSADKVVRTACEVLFAQHDRQGGQIRIAFGGIR